MPERRSLYRAVNRAQNNQRPNIPQNLAEVVIADPYDKSSSGARFLQYDNQNPRNRIILFYTVEGLQHLCGSRQVFCDGTFKTTPRLFCQHYTFHGIILNQPFPLVYGLTTRKTRATYEEMLRHLINHAAELSYRFEPQVML